MPSKDKTLKYCIKCRQTMSADNFYTSRDADKYPPDGKLPICKDCTAMHVNAWDESTFMDILQDLDLPYLPDVWKSLIEAKGNSPREVTGRYILGRYIARMRLAQYRKYRFADSQALQEKLLGAQKEAFQAAGLDGEALQAELDKLNSLPEQPEIVELLEEEDAPSANSPSLDQSLYYTDVDKEILSSLTPEDIRMLRNKWGSSYRPEEWLRMEQLYTDMMNSYDIQGAGHKDTLIMICKASLKANQLIDAGDIEGFQRVQKAYDSLMKSGKFTAAQNKETASEFIDSIGELVLLCEQQGFIPRYYTPGPQDAVDRTLQDLKQYTHSLVMEELNLGSMIESSLKQIMLDRENEAQIDTNTEEDKSVIGDDNLFDYSFADSSLSDADLADYKNQLVATAEMEEDDE